MNILEGTWTVFLPQLQGVVCVPPPLTDAGEAAGRLGMATRRGRVCLGPATRPSDSGSRPDLSSQWPAPARLPVRRGRAESGRQKERGDRKPSRTWGYANTCVACARSGLLTICRPVYQRIRSKARNGKTSFLHSSVCKIAPSLLPPSLPVFVCVLFMGTLEDLVSQTANLKGTNWQTRGNSQSTLIRGGV